MDKSRPKSSQKPSDQAARNLRMLLTAMAGVDDEPERVRLGATGISSLLPCRLSGMAIRREDDSAWDLTIQSDGIQLPSDEAQAILEEVDPIVRETLQSGELTSARLSGGSESSSPSPALGKLGIGYLTLIPVHTLHKRLGFLLIGREEGSSISAEEDSILRALSNHMAIGVENLRLQRAQERQSEILQQLVDERTTDLRRSEEQQRVLLAINNAIVGNLDKTSLFQAITQALRPIVEFDRASISLHDKARDIITLFALAGPAHRVRGLSEGTEIARKGSFLQKVIDEKRPRIRRDLTKERREGAEEDLLKLGIRSYVAVPLVAKGNVIGALSVASNTPDRYSARESEFLDQVGRQIGLALENMQAYEEIAALKLRLEKENTYLQEEIKHDHDFDDLIGKSKTFQSVLDQIGRVAPTDATVLLLGETGTGKELVARAVHARSDRSSKPLVKVNCGSIPESLMESEFFGHQKGSFTGAINDRAGRFELADKGTIFLDEIGELPTGLQVKLLRVLQEQEFERVGGSKTLKVDVRVIAATNRNLEDEVAAGRFRADLFYRLNIFPITLPPLRDRKGDILILAEHCLSRFSRKFGRKLTGFTPEGRERLLSYGWPGNVRELENLLEREAILAHGPLVAVGTIPTSTPRKAGVGASPASSSPDGSLEDVERNHILSVLKRTNWVIEGSNGAAQILGLHPNTLRSRLKKHSIQRTPS